jgi:hypothetical protein
MQFCPRGRQIAFEIATWRCGNYKLDALLYPPPWLTIRSRFSPEGCSAFPDSGLTNCFVLIFCERSQLPGVCTCHATFMYPLEKKSDTKAMGAPL